MLEIFFKIITECTLSVFQTNSINDFFNLLKVFSKLYQTSSFFLIQKHLFKTKSIFKKGHLIQRHYEILNFEI